MRRYEGRSPESWTEPNLRKKIHWHNDQRRIVRESSIDGRVIILNNDLERFYIPESFSVDRLHSAAHRSLEVIRKIEEKDGCARFSRNIKNRLESTYSICSAAEFGIWLDSVFEIREETWGSKSPKDGWGRADKTALLRFLRLCWLLEVLVFPLIDRFPTTKFVDDYIKELAPERYKAETEAITKIPENQQWLAKLQLCCHGLSSLVDLTPPILNPALLLAHRTKKDGMLRKLTQIPVPLVAFQKAHAGKSLTYTSAEYFEVRPRDMSRGRGGHDFAWCLVRDKGLERWRSLAEGFLAAQEVARPATQSLLNMFLEYLIANPHLPRDPLKFLDVDHHPEPLFEGSSANPNKHRDFIDWALDGPLADYDEVGGDNVRRAELRNPFTTAPQQRSRPETGRNPMPILLLQKALEILTANDWEWAKNKAGGARADGNIAGDWYKEFDAATGHFIRKWSPVRAMCLYVKLQTLFRTFQVRHLDSGEADCERVEVEHIHLEGQAERIYRRVKNPHQLASTPPKRAIRKGVLQTFPDESTGKLQPFFRISTNKSANRATEEWTTGYDCPWAPDDVVDIFLKLREWQELNNPVTTLTQWKDVPELKQKKGVKALDKLEGCFLFRDPTAKHPFHPISDSKVNVLWYDLCEEVEKRLRLEGYRDALGQPLPPLIIARSKGRPSRVLYELHSIRVTQLSAMHKAGVPLKVTMDIAGHSTVRMNLYYVKYGMTEIREIVSAVEAKIEFARQKEWADGVRELEEKQSSGLLAFNDPSAIGAFLSDSQGFVFMDVGICTAGCSRCHEGKLVMVANKKPQVAPVPGGRRNCADCRFLISGPPFLSGLTATVNVKSLGAVDVAKRLTAMQQKKSLIEHRRRESEKRGEQLTPEEWAELIKTSECLDSITSEFDQLMSEMSSAAALLSQCVTIHNDMLGSGALLNEKLSLYVKDLGTIKQQFEESPEFEALDKVCRSSIFFTSTKGATVEKANLKRNVYYDRMLSTHGLSPAFLTMDEDTALRTGNELSRLLYMRLGRERAINLLEGREKLTELGIVAEVFSALPINMKPFSLATTNISIPGIESFAQSA